MRTAREILFRGKRLDNGEWVYGDLLQFPNKTVIHSTVNGCRFAFDIDQSTIGQYTGLTDNNGKKIFEGDILEYNDGFYYFKKSVKYNLGSFGIDCAGKIELNFSEYDNFLGFLEMIWDSGDINQKVGDVEVIGNIYDNPERSNYNANDQQ